MAPILERYQPIAAAWLFGLVARGDARPESDVDIGLLLRNPRETAADQYLLLGELAARIESVTTPRIVDLVLLEPQGPMFCHRVLIEGVLICEPDRERRISFATRTVIRALDFRPTYELALAGQADGIRRRLRELP